MITINDVEYSEDDLSEEQKHLVGQVNNCRQQIAQLNAQAQVFAVAEKGFTDALIASVESTED